MKSSAHRRAARLFQILSHPIRLRILDELRRGEVCVCHLQATLRQRQPYISQQLSVLRDAGLVESHKKGLFVYYRLTDRWVMWLLEGLLGPAGEFAHRSGCICPDCETEELAANATNSVERLNQ